MTHSPRPRVVVVDGIPMSALVSQAQNPRAVIVAVHGGATSSAYFDCPGNPHLSLLRTAAARGFTAIALDRPGYGTSAVYSREYSDANRRVAAAFGAVDKILADADRGAGLFLVGHSAGCELALRMATTRCDVIGVEVAGTGLRYSPTAKAIISEATVTSRPAGLRDLLWQPLELYPADVLTGALSATGAAYEVEVTANWTRRDFPEIAARVRVPVGFSVGDHEKVWESTPEAGRDHGTVHRRTAGARQRNGRQRTQSQRRPDRRQVPPNGVVVHRGTYRGCSGPRSRASGGELMRVGFIGLGSQGGPMARRITEGGFETTLWARRQASLEPYADTPATTASSPAELAAASDLVCLCVVGDDDVREVLYGGSGVLTGLGEGGIVAIHSTVHPDTCREIAQEAAAQGVSVIDAPVSGGAPAVEQGSLLVMVGGDEDIAERCTPVFATYADPIVYLGPLGSGQNAKILNNLLFSANLGSAISTLELGESLGIPRDKLVDVVNRGSATSKALNSIAIFGGTLDGLAPIAGALLQKDVRHAASLAAAASAPEGAVFTAADAALESMDYRR